jgi:short-subunit dehydrogenase
MARRSLDRVRVLITGASRGIGRSIALALAEHHAQCVITARDESRLDRVAAEIRNRGGTAEVVAGDLTDDAVRHSLIQRAHDALGGLDLLVNNAGVGAFARFAESSDEVLRRVMELNFFAPVETLRLALPLLRQGRKPMVVNVASILGHRGAPSRSTYCASKFALRGFSESLRAELAPEGIDLLVVSPGLTETDFSDAKLERSGQERWGGRGGILPDVVARRTLRAIRAGRHEIVPSGTARLLMWLNRLSPRLVDALMVRFG